MKKTFSRKQKFNIICKVISYTLATFGILLTLGSVGALECNNIPISQFVLQLIVGCFSVFLALYISGVRQYVTGDYIAKDEYDYD